MHLHKRQANLLHSLLKGPLPHNALTHDVIALLGHLGEVEDHGHNNLLCRIGGEQRILKKPSGKNPSAEELSEIRHFLVSAGVGTLPLEAEADEAEHVEESASIVVIDHHAARFYQTTETSRPEAQGKTAPRDPHGFHRHLIHRKQANYQGDRVPEDDAFYKAVADRLKDASAIVIVGHGTGKSDAAAYLLDYLKKHHAYIAARVVGVEIADLSALTDPQIEALAEQYMHPRGAA